MCEQTASVLRFEINIGRMMSVKTFISALNPNILCLARLIRRFQLSNHLVEEANYITFSRNNRLHPTFSSLLSTLPSFRN